MNVFLSTFTQVTKVELLENVKANVTLSRCLLGSVVLFGWTTTKWCASTFETAEGDNNKLAICFFAYCTVVGNVVGSVMIW